MVGNQGQNWVFDQCAIVKTPSERKKSGGKLFFPCGWLSITFFYKKSIFCEYAKIPLTMHSYAFSYWVQRKNYLRKSFLLRPRSYAGFELQIPMHKSTDFFARELSWCVCFSNGRFKELLNKISWNSRKSKMISQDPRLSGWFCKIEFRWGPLSRFLCLFLRIWIWRRQT